MSIWKEFFDGHAPEYMENPFTDNTAREVDFILEELDLPPGGHILDVGCGTGRHAVLLAQRGYQVTGVDLSSSMLDEAKKNACEAGVSLRLIHDNAVHYREKDIYHGAICLCEGAFCLLEEGEDPIQRDLAILKNVAYSLKRGSFFLLTALNGFSKIRSFSNEDVKKGDFIPEKMLDYSLLQWKSKTGEQKERRVLERGYLPTEIQLMVDLAGLTLKEIWGGTAGDWGQRQLDLDEIEIMYLIQKEG